MGNRGKKIAKQDRTKREQEPSVVGVSVEVRLADAVSNAVCWKRLWNPTFGITLGFFLFFWWLLSVRYGNLLYLAQNGTIFLNTTVFFHEQCATLGGTLGYFVRFLLQMGVYPGLCGAVLAAMAVGSGVWIQRYCGIRGMVAPLAFLPACLWMITLPVMREYLYEFTTIPWPFSLMSGILGSMAIAALVEEIRNRTSKTNGIGTTVAILLTVLLYPFIGFFALLGGLYSLIMAFRQRGESDGVWGSELRDKPSNESSNESGSESPNESGSELDDDRARNRMEHGVTVAVMGVTIGLTPLIYRLSQWFPPIRVDLLYFVGVAYVPTEIATDRFIPLLTNILIVSQVVVVTLMVLWTVTPWGHRTENRKKNFTPNDSTENRNSRQNTVGNTARNITENTTENTAKNIAKNIVGKGTSPRNTVPSDGNPIAGNTLEKTSRNRSLRATVPLMLFLFLGWFTQRYAFADPDFLTTLAMLRAAELEQWQQVLDLEEGLVSPGRGVVMLRNLAMFELGRQGDAFFSRPQSTGVHDPFEWYFGKGRLAKTLTMGLRSDNIVNDDPAVRMSTDRVGGDFVLYRYGFVNYALRSTTNHYVCSDKTVWNLKMMALEAMAAGEKELARRSLRMLAQTSFHRAWAKRYLAVLDGEHPADDPIAQSCRRVQERMIDQDYFGKDLLPESIVYDQRTRTTGPDRRPEVRDQRLILWLMLQDIDQFRQAMLANEAVFRGKPLPRHFQEGLLFLELQRGDHLRDRFMFTPDVLERFARYRTILSDYQRDHDQPKMYRRLCDTMYDSWWRFMSSDINVWFY